MQHTDAKHKVNFPRQDIFPASYQIP